MAQAVGEVNMADGKKLGEFGVERIRVWTSRDGVENSYRIEGVWSPEGIVLPETKTRISGRLPKDESDIEDVVLTVSRNDEWHCGGIDHPIPEEAMLKIAGFHIVALRNLRCAMVNSEAAARSLHGVVLVEATLEVSIRRVIHHVEQHMETVVKVSQTLAARE
jgi:hypothetical protein